MSLVDLTQPLDERAYTPPGFKAPRLERIIKSSPDGLNDSLIELWVHSGTHLDAPMHIRDDGAGVSDIQLDRLISQAVVWPVTGLTARSIDPPELAAAMPAVERGDFVLLSTGWFRYFREPSKYALHPWLTSSSAEWFVERGVRLVGIDAPTPDLPYPLRPKDFGYPVHQILLNAGVLILENLASLEALVGRRIRLIVLPIPLARADGSPARVVAEY